MASKKKKNNKSGTAAAATAMPIFAIDADDAARPQKKQKNLSVEVIDVDNDKSQSNPPPPNKNKRKRGKSSVVRSTSAPKKHGLKIKSAKKTILSEDRPRTHAERAAALGKTGQRSLFAYADFPRGAKPKASRASEPMVDISAAEKEKELPEPFKKVSKRASRGSYRNWNEGIYKTAMNDAVKSMLVSGGNVAIALEAASMDIPRQSLLSRYRRAKNIIEEGRDEKHIKDKDNLAIFNRKEKVDQWSERKKGSGTSYWHQNEGLAPRCSMC